MKYHVYVSNSGSRHFSKFLFDDSSGEMTAQPDIPLDSEPGAVATNGTGTRLYLCLRKSSRYQSFAVDSISGRLSPLNRTPEFRAGPYVALDKSDRYLLTVFRSAGAVGVYALNDDGSIGERRQLLETVQFPHSIQVDKTNRYAYVPHTNPGNAIYQYRFDESTGRLSANEPAVIRPETPEGPRHCVFHPRAGYLYSVNEQGNTVSVFRLHPATGVLSALQVISTLPRKFRFWRGRNQTAEIRISPDGNYLYASNRGHDSLAIFAVEDNGQLTALGHQATESKPRFFDLDPSGQFVFSAGTQSGHVSVYRINTDGSLRHLSRHRVGESPLWIQFVAEGRPGSA